MKQRKVGQNRTVKNIQTKQSKRLEIASFPRNLTIIISVLLLAAALLAAYAQFRPVVFSVPTPAYHYSRNTNIEYQILNRTNDSFDQTIQGMDSVYLKENAYKILPVISYEINGNNVVSIHGSYQMVGIIRLRDKSNPNDIILENTIPLAERVEIDTVASGINIVQSAQADFESIYSWIDNNQQGTDRDISYELETGLQTDFIFSKAGREIARIQERPGLKLPLQSDTFTVTRLELEDKSDTIWQLQGWQLQLTPMPIWVYPVVILLSLSLLIFFLAVTKSRKKPHFNSKLNRMMRMAKGRLMIIGDKAWEPEWCITVSNFKAMVRTARKLKHPIFCYVDRDNSVLSAFFYVYYGENNYCYSYTGQSERKRNKKSRKSDQQFDRQSALVSEPLIDLPTSENKPLVNRPLKTANQSTIDSPNKGNIGIPEEGDTKIT